MIQLTETGVFLSPAGSMVKSPSISREEAEKNTISDQILSSHNHSADRKNLKLTFDSLVSPDNNYVNILQTARASGLKKFPVPYVLSNCHHTLCAVGGTINEDDHVFGLDNVKRYGGIFLPPYRGVLHQYMRERMASCGGMILGSDSHTRYGALGTMGIGEGGGEVVKQLLGKTYDIPKPPVLAVKLTGKPRDGVGPMDVALVLVGATFKNGFNKNKILEFLGEGIKNLSVEFRMGIDVMTTESAALSSIWCTDEMVREYLKIHKREDSYKKLEPSGVAYYDGMIEIDLSKVEPMMALPFHPSNVISIREFKKNPEKYLKAVEEEGNLIKGEKGKKFSIMDHLEEGNLRVDQALVSGCAGGMFENIAAMADILDGYHIGGSQTGIGINPSSQPVNLALMKQGILNRLILSGATIRPCICGPCFGVTDVPADNSLSIRHTTRNYPNREGSKPGQGQMAASILMDARSVAATVRNNGYLTAATELDVTYTYPEYEYDPEVYEKQVYDNFGHENPDYVLRMGPNIADWPEMVPMGRHLLLKVAGSYEGSVTTDELIPSGDASSYRSNPEKISEYTMISRDPEYVGRAKQVRNLSGELTKKGTVSDEECARIIREICSDTGCTLKDITIGSIMVSQEIGDGSSREQAASCQKVLGGFANLANAYSTKRYRSNLINWGILPLQTDEKLDIPNGTYLFIENVREKVRKGGDRISLRVMDGSGKVYSCSVGVMTEVEKEIVLSGCLINYYKTTN
ncbi:hydratase [Clostridium sp. Marseille-P2415]|uniref:hydratase n=1 Tax=Clostridium sp. Marseille-P2415 TaxID=1805471 RepID=UPI0009886202|nr:hydratase [Clostridium sp. Marseille-P2415]